MATQLFSELHEELRLSIEPDELELKGAVYSRLSEGTLKHVAIIYEWKAPHDDVAITSSSAEFFERRGTSLSGTFVPVEDLAKDVENGKLTEEWSAIIIREFLAKGDHNFSLQLFS